MGLLRGCFSVPWTAVGPLILALFLAECTTEVAGSCPGGKKASVLETELCAASAGWQNSAGRGDVPSWKIARRRVLNIILNRYL